MTLKDSYSKIKPIRLVFWAQLYVFINQLCLEFEGTNRATVELNLINTPGYFSTLTFATSSPKTPCINIRTCILETHMDAQVGVPRRYAGKTSPGLPLVPRVEGNELGGKGTHNFIFSVPFLRHFFLILYAVYLLVCG